MTEYKIEITTDKEGDEKIIIGSGSLEIWIFEDSVVGEYQVHYKGGLSKSYEWVEDRREAILKALTQLKILE